ncbi:MAG TPA: hypothetical protein VFO61_05000 [Alphaproteobacteria bacterium]|nr:hypothetical protein [Alphaproteobacteria bacterium]
MTAHRKTWRRGAALAISLAFGATAYAALPAAADPIPSGGQSHNLEVIGFSGLGGHPGAFKIVPHHKNGHWYIYAGHSFDQGWSIIDVTDPKNPRYVKFIPYKTPNKKVLTAQMTLHGDIMVTAIDKKSKVDPAIIIWDISDPENPKQIGTWKGAEGGSHRNTYPGGKYAYLATFAKGYHGKGHVMVILDVSDPRHPKQVGVFAQPGQKDGETLPKDHAPGFHGPVNVSPDGKMATFGFSPDVVNVDITDHAHPKLIGRLTMSPPFMYAGNQTVHTALPIWDRKLIYASSEASKWGCDKDGMNWAAMIDNKDPAHPRLMSIFPHPLPPPGSPYKDFCQKEGRFGPHNVVMEQHNQDVHRTTNVLYIAWFNAGLRSWDISDPYQPTNIGYFIPPENPHAKKHGGPHESPTNWTEDVTQDTRGYIYADDDKWGLWILRDPTQK